MKIALCCYPQRDCGIVTGAALQKAYNLGHTPPFTPPHSMADTKSIPPEVLEALKRGDKIGAVKLMVSASKSGRFQATGLMEAKKILDALGDSSVAERVRITETASLPPEVTAALRSGNKIEAIKLLRAQTGAGLAEAKNAVEAHEAGMDSPVGARAPKATVSISVRPKASGATAAPILRDGLSPGEEPRTSGGTAAFILIAIVVAAIWLYSVFG